MLLSPAGTRPEPAVSVPSAIGTRPAPTAMPEPLLEPPGISAGLNRFRGDAVGAAHADQAGRELIQIGLADDDGPCPLEPGHRGRVLRRLIGERRAGRRGRQTLDVDVVFYGDRHAIERPVGVRFVSQCPRFRTCVGLVTQRNEDGGIVVRTNSRKAACDRLFGRCGSCPMCLDDRSGGSAHSTPARPSAGEPRRRKPWPPDWSPLQPRTPRSGPLAPFPRKAASNMPAEPR